MTTTFIRRLNIGQQIRKLTTCLAAGLLIMATADRASAATQNYGDFMGTSITYENVIENSGIDPLLFGGPTIVGDSLLFTPTNFSAQVNGSGAVIKDSQIQFTLDGKNDNAIQGIHLSETGDYSFLSLGATSAVSVGMALFWQITEIDGISMLGPNGSANMLVSSGDGPNGGVFMVNNEIQTSVIWDGGLDIDFDQAIADDSNVDGDHATRVLITFDNTLGAFTDGGAAFIKKKGLGFGVEIEVNPGGDPDVDPVPEPPAIVLGITGALALAFCVWNRRRKAATA